MGILLNIDKPGGIERQRSNLCIPRSLRPFLAAPCLSQGLIAWARSRPAAKGGDPNGGGGLAAFPHGGFVPLISPASSTYVQHIALHDTKHMAWWLNFAFSSWLKDLAGHHVLLCLSPQRCQPMGPVSSSWVSSSPLTGRNRPTSFRYRPMYKWSGDHTVNNYHQHSKTNAKVIWNPSNVWHIFGIPLAFPVHISTLGQSLKGKDQSLSDKAGETKLRSNAVSSSWNLYIHE